MLDFLVSWTEQLIITMVIIVIIEMVLPSDSSYRKYIKVIMGIFLIYIIVSPLLSNKLNNFEFGKILATESEVPQNLANVIDYDRYVLETYKAKLQESMEQFLLEKGYKLVKFNAELYYEEKNMRIDSVALKIKQEGKNKRIEVNKITIGKDAKIDNQKIEELKKTIGDYYDIDVSKIAISERES